MADLLRENATKAALVKSSNAAFTSADWTAVVAGLPTGNRQGLVGMTVGVAGDAEMTVDGTTHKPMLPFQFALLLAELIDNGLYLNPRYVTVQTAADLLNEANAAIVVQKIPYPEHAYRTNGSICFKVVATSGDLNARLRAQQVLAVGTILSLQHDHRILFLSEIESEVLGQVLAQQEQGKMASDKKAPFIHLARTQAITPEKRALWMRIQRLQIIFGDKFVTLF
jgi:hypothetical protein